MVLKTQIDPRSAGFRRNFQAMKEKVTTLKKNLEQAKTGGYAPQRDRQKNRRYSVRERIEKLKDPGTCFLEFSPLAGRGLYKEDITSSGIVTGVAVVRGRPCVVLANEAGVKGGAYFPVTIKKHLRAQDIALENHLPCLYLVDSGGAYLPYQDEIFPDRDHFGRLFYNQARMSAKGIAQIALVFGHCTAGGAYVPAMADENIIVKGAGTIFLAGPPLVEAATGEKVSAEDLGGAILHSSRSGVSDYIAEDEDQALEKARDIVSCLGMFQRQNRRLQESKAPLYPAEEMYGIVSSDLKTAFDIREIIARLTDGSELHEFKKNYGSTLVTGWAHICGHQVGILGNNGVLFGESALKAAHFIDLCDSRGIPLLFLQNIVGFMVGKQYESAGITKQGAKMVTAVSLARVPKFTVIVGASYGAGNYGMCGRAYQPRQLWLWPSARIAVMGGPQAEKVLKTIKSRKSATKDRSKADLFAEQVKPLKAGGASLPAKESLKEQYDRQSSPYYSTARLWDDGIIDPIDTRKVLALGLDLSLYAPLPKKSKGIYRM